MSGVLRAVAFAAGLVLLAATAHVNVTNAGGYGTPGSILMLANALGVAVGALAIGHAWSARRYALAAWLALAIISGEAFAFTMSAERLVVGREDQQAPLRDAEEGHARASQRVALAAAALAAAPATSPRLEAAIAGKAAADAAAVGKSAERGCAANCRSLLQAQVDGATSELAAARAEIEIGRAAADRELAAARVALAGMKAPASATPLADRVGIPAWIIDLVAAALGSVAVNGLGCGLIAFAAHGRREEKAAAVEIVTPAAAALARGWIAPFLRRAIEPSAGGEISLRELRQLYLKYCDREKLKPMPAAEFGHDLRDLLDALRLPTLQTAGDIIVRGATLRDGCRATVAIDRQPSRRRALGRMATIGARPN